MEISTIIPHIEALVFASDKPLTAPEVTEYVNNALGFIEDRANLEQVEFAIEGIKEKYDSEFYAFELKQSGGGWQFLTKPEYHKTVALINGDKFIKKLSTASLETLAIIAYKQPITKSEIESIRGVNCDYAVQKLLEKDLVIISGRNEDAVGKPLIYNTSKSFMDYFGINSADELPKISEVLMEQFEQATTMSDILAANAAEAEQKERENLPNENLVTDDKINKPEQVEMSEATEEEIIETGTVLAEETIEEEIIETGFVVNAKNKDTESKATGETIAAANQQDISDAAEEDKKEEEPA
ncbi:MAG: SMC-Scp complex subunit ScpB [Ferruginibacter sp.]|nr:SMC-Scp complex subunit ScpB [Ferruginibacter sp.]